MPLAGFCQKRFYEHGALNRQNRHCDEQRPQAELKPAAFALWRVGFGRLGFHRRNIFGLGQTEQAILAATVDYVAGDSESLPAAGRGTG